MRKYEFNGHLHPTPDGMLPLQMSGDVYLAAEVERSLVEARKQLIRLASDLVCGRLLPSIDTDHWYKSTPMAERRQITSAIEAAHEAHKVIGMGLKNLVDGLPPTVLEQQ